MQNYSHFNPTIATDAYKITHWLQRPKNLSQFMSYGEPRIGGQYSRVLFFGMNYLIKKYFRTPLTMEHIEQGRESCLEWFGYDYFPMEIWKKVLKLGYYPIQIKAAPEGSLIPVSNVFFTIEATEPWFAPMISHFEDWLMWIWYSSSVATRSFFIKKNLIPIFEKTSDVPFLGFAVNDFGYRGGTFNEGASIGGAAHLLSFDGTDNGGARQLIHNFYGNEWYGKSVWATEHSVATVWGPKRGEFDYIKAQLERSNPESIVSIVIDSYDSNAFMKEVVGSEEISNLIKARPGRVVFRPDSGDPLRNICFYTDILGDIFGYTMNHKGYKLLGHNVGLLQGDGMDEQSIIKIYEDYTHTGWSADNFITGSGGGLLEVDLNRDTQRWAIKVCYAEIDGKSINVSKSPKTDMTKASKAGILKLHNPGDNRFMTISSANHKDNIPLFNAYQDSLEVVYRNGELLVDPSFSEVRTRANSFL